MDLTLKQKNQLTELIKKNQLGLLCLFGSQITGTASPESDLDIGYLATDTLGYQAEKNLTEDLMRIFGITIDLCNLKTVSPLLKMQTVKSGIFFVQNQRTETTYKVKAIAEYFDTVYLRQLTHKYNRTQI